MDFFYYDLFFLILFVVFISIFLYKRKKNLKKEGWLFLYRTKWGMKQIEKIAKRFPRTLNFLSYVSISIGYLLVIVAIYLFVMLIYTYFSQPSLVKAVKVPPIMPLLPYFPKMFKLTFLPNFYFSYWIIIIAIIAIVHEFAHGIFMRVYKIKIKSTGFGFFPFFLPVFFAAFVEQDEKSMKKAKIFHQKAVLSAGTFANLLTGLIFFGITIGFFLFAFSPSGVLFSSYAFTGENIHNISAINNISVSNLSYQGLIDIIGDKRLNEVVVGNKTYFLDKEFIEHPSMKKLIQENNQVILFYDAPAINSGLKGAILEINNNAIKNLEDLQEELNKYSPNETIAVKTTEGVYEITLTEHLLNHSKGWLGVFFSKPQKRGVIGKFFQWITSFKKPFVYYKPKFSTSDFIYYLLWWLVIVSFSVALINMLPMGIFDGGRFFYLTILSITKSEKKARKIFEAMTFILLFLILLLMFFWIKSFI